MTRGCCSCYVKPLGHRNVVREFWLSTTPRDVVSLLSVGLSGFAWFAVLSARRPVPGCRRRRRIVSEPMKCSRSAASSVLTSRTATASGLSSSSVIVARSSDSPLGPTSSRPRTAAHGADGRLVALGSRGHNLATRDNNRGVSGVRRVDARSALLGRREQAIVQRGSHTARTRSSRGRQPRKGRLEAGVCR